MYIYGDEFTRCLFKPIWRLYLNFIRGIVGVGGGFIAFVVSFICIEYARGSLYIGFVLGRWIKRWRFVR